MKLILEIEETDDLQRLERVIALLKPYLPKVQSSERLSKVRNFIGFVEHEGILVEKLNIPERDARNVR